MENERFQSQHKENSLSSSPSVIRNDTASKSSEPLKNAATEQNQSASAPSTQPYTALKKRDWSPHDLATRSLTSEAEPDGDITVCQMTVCQLSRPSSSTRANCSPGSPPKLDFSSAVWTIRNIAPIVAYILPSEEAEEWLGDLLEVNNELLNAGLQRRKVEAIALLRIMQLIWAAYKIEWLDFINTDWDGRE